MHREGGLGHLPVAVVCISVPLLPCHCCSTSALLCLCKAAFCSCFIRLEKCLSKILRVKEEEVLVQHMSLFFMVQDVTMHNILNTNPPIIAT